jgi:hypothetical protein
MSEEDQDKSVQVPLGACGQPAFSEDGLDLTLIRWMLSLTPTERLEALQDVIWSIVRLRGEALEEAEAGNRSSDKIPPDGD